MHFTLSITQDWIHIKVLGIVWTIWCIFQIKAAFERPVLKVHGHTALDGWKGFDGHAQLLLVQKCYCCIILQTTGGQTTTKLFVHTQANHINQNQLQFHTLLCSHTFSGVIARNLLHLHICKPLLYFTTKMKHWVWKRSPEIPRLSLEQ